MQVYFILIKPNNKNLVFADGCLTSRDTYPTQKVPFIILLSSFWNTTNLNCIFFFENFDRRHHSTLPHRPIHTRLRLCRSLSSGALEATTTNWPRYSHLKHRRQTDYVDRLSFTMYKAQVCWPRLPAGYAWGRLHNLDKARTNVSRLFLRVLKQVFQLIPVILERFPGMSSECITSDLNMSCLPHVNCNNCQVLQLQVLNGKNNAWISLITLIWDC